MKGTNIMNSKVTLVTCALVTYTTFAMLPAAKGEAEQTQFDSAQQAANALLQVAANFDPAAVKEIVGPDSEDIVSSEDPVADKNEAQALAAKAKEKLSIDLDKKDPAHAIISVGNDGYPLPIPLVKRNDKWSFDTKAGRQARRLGVAECGWELGWASRARSSQGITGRLLRQARDCLPRLLLQGAERAGTSCCANG
jgi:hypothetical protein